MRLSAIGSALRSQWAVTIGVTAFFTSFIAVTYGFGIYLFPVIVADIRADIGLSYADVGIVTASAQFGFLAAAPLAGLLAPSIGGGRIILGSVVLCALSLLALNQAKGFWTAGIPLTVLGAMAASVYVPMVAVCQRVVPRHHRGKALGLISSGTSYGVFINGLLAPYFITTHDWRALYLSVGLGTAALVAVAAIYLARTGVFRQAESLEGGPDLPGLQRVRSLLTPNTLRVWAVMFLSGLAFMSYQTYLSAYLREELEYSVEFAGRIWTLVGLVGMFGGFAMGALADRITIRATIGLTFVLLALSVVLILFWPQESPLFFAAVLFSLSFYALFGLIPAYISRVASAASATAIFGLGNIFLGGGGMLGNFAGGYLKTETGTFVWTYAIILLAAGVLFLLTIALRNERRFDEAPLVAVGAGEEGRCL